MAQTLVDSGRVPFQGVKPQGAGQTAPSGIITTFAGDGYMGNDGNSGLATNAHLITPTSVAVDSAGNVYVSDLYGQVVRKVTASTGMITAFAGNGDAGYSGDKGPATKAQLNEPAGLAVDSSGNVYIADALNNVIRKVTAGTGIITTVAGNGYGAGPGAGIKCGVRTDGVAATASTLCYPQGVAVDQAGNLFIADTDNHVIREVTARTGIITTVAGNGNYGLFGDGGLAVNASFSYPYGVAADSSGNLYIADTNNCSIRKVTASTGIVSSVAGSLNGGGQVSCNLSGDGGPATSASLNHPMGLAMDESGNLFFADTESSLVRVIAGSNGNVYTVAGSYLTYSNYGSVFVEPAWGYAGDNGPAGFASLDYPTGVAADGSGSLYIADEYNSAIRKVSLAAVLPTESPVFSPLPGVITSAVSVTITSPVTGATIYYTTDGSTPTTASAKYSGPISSVKTGTITAFSTIPGSPSSLGVIARYFYAPTPVISPGSENITKATSVTISEANTAATVYYTTDGSNPVLSSTAKIYSGAISITGTTTVYALAKVTDAQGYSTWSAQAAATYSLTAAPSIAAETFNESSSSVGYLTAQINPNNEPTQSWFAYGTGATALTNTTATTSGLTGTTNSQVNAYLSGLTPNTTYYFQAVASNSLGTTKGVVVSFTTSFYADQPVITPGSEIITKPIQVTITEDNPAATIYYTTDGSEPENNPASAKRYTGAITISTTTTLIAEAKAVSTQQVVLWGGWTVATYTVPTAPTVTSETASEQSGTQETLNAYINPNGATTQYWFAYGTSATALSSSTATTQGLTGTTSQYVSGSLSGLTPNKTYYYQAVASNSTGTTKGTVQSFTLNYYAPTPVISPGSENVTKPIKVTITQPNPAATIYYTTDGSYPCYNPAASQYTGPITVSVTTTLTAASEVTNSQQSTLCSQTATATYVLAAAATVSNESAYVFSTNSAQVSSQVNPNGETTRSWFVYGTSATALTNTTNQTGGLTGATGSTVYGSIKGLTTKTMYYYQGVASNSLGTTKGTVQSFTTQ